jgi:outer membrane protein OmpA-like peptidoglycan-associated protein
MKKINLIVVACSLTTTLAMLAQPSEKPKFGAASDCEKAIDILINRNKIYGPTAAPLGFGDIQEITAKKNLLFEKEHFTAWYRLSVERDGELVFEVVPTNPKDDYDFIVFKYDEALCKTIMSPGQVPIRSNLSRVDKSIQGISGLMANVKNTSVGMGVGNAYCRSMTVKKGEKYILVLDNVYPNGQGHTIFFNFLKQVEIKGKIVDSNNIPVEAEVSLADNFGNVVQKINSDKNGQYDMKTFMKEAVNYNLITNSPKTFITTRTLNSDALKDGVFDSVNTILPVLKEGARYNLGNIIFYGDLADLLPASYPSAESLYELLSKNKKLVIQIEGHVNKGTVKDEKDELFNQTLSEQRALTIYNYLVKRGISKNRLSTVGLSASQMIYPAPKNLSEQEANRRVEIKITSMN